MAMTHHGNDTPAEQHGSVGLIIVFVARQLLLIAAAWKHGLPTQVKGLEFNSFSPNLLASGATDGELCIWDVANPSQPSLYPGLKVGAGRLSATPIPEHTWSCAPRGARRPALCNAGISCAV